jgi:hypothetical protein
MKVADCEEPDYQCHQIHAIGAYTENIRQSRDISQAPDPQRPRQGTVFAYVGSFGGTDPTSRLG